MWYTLLSKLKGCQQSVKCSENQSPNTKFTSSYRHRRITCKMLNLYSVVQLLEVEYPLKIWDWMFQISNFIRWWAIYMYTMKYLGHETCLNTKFIHVSYTNNTHSLKEILYSIFISFLHAYAHGAEFYTLRVMCQIWDVGLSDVVCSVWFPHLQGFQFVLSIVNFLFKFHNQKRT